MAIEDFSTYTESDQDSKVTITPSKCSWAGAETRNYTYYVYKDYGVGYFGDFEHDLEWYLSDSGSTAVSFFWALSNTVGDGRTIELAAEHAPVIWAYSADYDIHFGDAEESSTDFYNAAASTLYYLTVSRTGTTGTCLIYSDSARTTLLDTLTITLPTTTFRYAYCFAGYDTNAGLGAASTGYSQNLEFIVGLASITGTATVSITEADIVAGGKTIIITLDGTTWKLA